MSGSWQTLPGLAWVIEPLDFLGYRRAHFLNTWQLGGVMWLILANEVKQRGPVSILDSQSRRSLYNSRVSLCFCECGTQVLKWWGWKITESLHGAQEPRQAPDLQQILREQEIHFYVLNHWDLGVLAMPKACLAELLQGSDYTNTTKTFWHLFWNAFCSSRKK